MVRELHQRCVQWQFYGLADELLDVCESAIYYQAPLGDTQDRVEEIALEVEELIEAAKATPTEAELASKFGGFECADCE